MVGDNECIDKSADATASCPHQFILQDHAQHNIHDNRKGVAHTHLTSVLHMYI